MVGTPLAFASLVGCVLGQGFFSGAEAALVAADRDLLRAAAEGGHEGARVALFLVEREDQLLRTCLIGGTTCVVGAGTLLSALLLDRPAPELWVVACLAPAVVVFGEALPRTVYAHHADALAPRISRPIRALQWALAPLLAALAAWSALWQRTPGEPETVSRESIVDLLDGADADGDIDPQDRALIRRLFELDSMRVESCMTPLVDIVAVPTTAAISEAVARVLQHGKSRILVFEDRVDNIVGVVDYRDLLFAAPDPERAVTTIARPVRYVPEAQRGSVLLGELREQAEHLAVVVDEYGGAVGLVTMEDLLEEVVGEIRDERDKSGPGIRRLSERDWRVPARLEIEAVGAAVGHPLPEGDYETVAGLVLARLGRIPEAGEVVRIAGFTLQIEAATDRAIQTVRLTTPPPPRAS